MNSKNKENVINALNANSNNFVILLCGILTYLFLPYSKWILISPLICVISIFISQFSYGFLLHTDKLLNKYSLSVRILINILNTLNILYVMGFLLHYIIKK